MRRKRWVIFLIIFFTVTMLAGFTNPVNAKETRYRLDFGRVEPWEETAIERSLLIRSAFPDFNMMVVEANPHLVNAAGRKLSAHRLKLAVNNQLFDLGDAPLHIKPNQLTPASILNFQVKLILEPQDVPGVYQGCLVIRLDGENATDDLVVEMNVEIKPWVKMETDSQLLMLDQLYTNSSFLQNSQPLEVRVASNTDWVLCVAVSKCENGPKNENMQFAIIPTASVGVQIEPEFDINPNDGKRRLAMGMQTTSNGYWKTITLAVMVKEVKKLPAGRYDFELLFMLNPWK